MRLTHLARRTEGKSALEILYEIIDSKTIKGSTNTGFIIGKNSAVCFQEVPLYSIAENIQYVVDAQKEWPSQKRLRYEAYGLRFNKGQLFYKYKARPVLYGPKDEMTAMLPESEHWRIVTLDLSDHTRIVDWTHEREWRVKGDLSFDYSEVEVIVENPEAYHDFIAHYQAVNPEVLQNIQGIIVLDSLLK